MEGGACNGSTCSSDTPARMAASEMGPRRPQHDEIPVSSLAARKDDEGILAPRLAASGEGDVPQQQQQQPPAENGAAVTAQKSPEDGNNALPTASQLPPKPPPPPFPPPPLQLRPSSDGDDGDSNACLDDMIDRSYHSHKSFLRAGRAGGVPLSSLSGRSDSPSPGAGAAKRGVGLAAALRQESPLRVRPRGNGDVGQAGGAVAAAASGARSRGTGTRAPAPQIGMYAALSSPDLVADFSQKPTHPPQGNSSGRARAQSPFGRQEQGPSPPVQSLAEPIPFTSSMSAPSPDISSQKQRGGWMNPLAFRRQTSSVSAAAAAATAGRSWDEDSDLDFDDGLSELVPSSSEDVLDGGPTRDDDDDDFYDSLPDAHHGLHTPHRRPYSDDGAGASPPQSPLTDENVDIDNEDLMMRMSSPRSDLLGTGPSFPRDDSSSISSRSSSLDSDELLEEEVMDRLAAELSTPRARPGRSGRGRYLFRGAGTMVGSSGQAGHRVRSGAAAAASSTLENVAELPQEEEDAEDVVATASENETVDTHEETTTAPESSPETLPDTVAGSKGIGDDGRGEDSGIVDSKAETSDPHGTSSPPAPNLYQSSSSIQVSGSVEYFEYDPEAPLSPPPGLDFECAPTPVASNHHKTMRSIGDVPRLASFDTFEVDDAEAAGLSLPSISTAAATGRGRPQSEGPSIASRVSAADTKETFMSLFTLITREHMDARTLIYLSTFAVFGSTLRVYIARFFGLDCEFPDLVGDFFSKAAKHICVTSSGRTEQTGGAIFTDLPANMIGSFFMGVMSTSVSSWPNIPWLKASHPLQQHNSMHIAIRTGLCGSLTTFASWNAQMVLMLDGTGLPLGRQILPAIFGYILGLQAAVASFLFGRQVNTWLNRWKNPDICIEQDVESYRGRGAGRRSSTQTVRHRNRSSGSRRTLSGVPEDIDVPGDDFLEQRRIRKEKRRRRARAMSRDTNNSTNSLQGFNAPPRTIIVLPTLGDPKSDNCCQRFMGKTLRWRMIPFLLLAVLFSLYVVSDFVWGFAFYRTMWLSVIFTPFGAILRYKLQLLNGKFCKKRRWIPAGTIIANIIGSISAIAAVAVETRYIDGEDTTLWSVYLLTAVKIGFAGSLSTVSTYVKEVVDITERYPLHAKGYSYAFATICCCCVLGLLIYSPIVRA